jgi:aldehyde:ferredoxin oxidoreductase
MSFSEIKTACFNGIKLREHLLPHGGTEPMFGLYNVVARVDATQKSFALKVISDEILRKTLGGKGLATHLLLSYDSPDVDALDPESHLVLAIGPASGTGIPGSCCHGIFTKASQTGYYAEFHAEANVAECIAGSGFDAVVIHGASQDPVWIEASEETIAFHPAEDLWGLDTQQTENRIVAWIREHRPAARKCGVVAIGPESENPTAVSANENNKWRPGGNTGIGTVIGSKRIKAVVFWGNRHREVADPHLVEHLARDLAQRATRQANGASCSFTHAAGWGQKAGSKLSPNELFKLIGLNPIQGKADALAELEDRLTILDCLILCRSHLDLYLWGDLAAIIRGMMGMELTDAGMRSIAAGIINGSRRLNHWEAATTEGDGLPEPFWAKVFSEIGGTVGEEQMKQLLSDYYRVRGWDDTGRPT